MKVDKISISLEAALAADVREAARRSGMSLSAWVAEAVRARRQQDAFWEFIREWEAEHGPISEEDKAWARANQGELVGPPAA